LFTLKCPDCGWRFRDRDRYCPHCGADLEAPIEETEEQPVAQEATPTAAEGSATAHNLAGNATDQSLATRQDTVLRISEVQLITCSQCKTQNPPDRDTCRQCNADMLPRPKAARRTWSVISAAFLGLIIIAIGLVPFYYWRTEPHMEACSGFAIIVMIAGGIVLLRGVLRALRPPDLYALYLKRAVMHAQEDSDQAVADFVLGAMLAPAKARTGLTQQIPNRLKKVISLAGSELSLSSTGDNSPETIRKIMYAAYITWASLAERIPEYVHATSFGFEAGLESATAYAKRGQVESGLEKIFNGLWGAGLVKNLGYCRRCKAVVDCDEAGKCANDMKHGAAQGIVYVVPEDVTLISKRLQQVHGS